MADDKVFLYAPSIDKEALMQHPDLANNPYYKLGADPGLTQLVPPRDSLFAFDARTGKLLWQYHGEPGSAQGVGGKGGRASTPCYDKGKVYVRGGRSVICFDAETGEQVWVSGDYNLKSTPSDGSVTMIGGALVLTHATANGWATVGLNPQDGTKKWSIDNAGGGGSSHAWPAMGIPGLYRENGKEYLVLGRSRPLEKREDKTFMPPEKFMMVDPVDGRILWESSALRYNDGQILVIGDMAIGNVSPYAPELSLKTKGQPHYHRIGGAKISTKGAKLIWKSDKVHPTTSRQFSIANRGVYYGDSRVTGFTATDITNGELLGKHPGIYELSHTSHNWAWQIASNDRIITDGILMFSTADQGLKLSPDRLGNSVAGGYLSPTKPAIADGRLIFRMDDKLVCFDLRMADAAAAKTE